MQVIILHPSCITIISSILLLVYRNILRANNSNYLGVMCYVLSIIPTLLVFVSLYFLDGQYNINISSNSSIIFQFSYDNRLICCALNIMFLSSNLNSLSNNRIFELILGSIIAGCSYLLIFSSDFISLFIAIEISAIAGAILIFYSGNSKKHLISSNRYFYTHLVCGYMVLLGVLYIKEATGNYNIINMSNFYQTSQIAAIVTVIMLLGFLISLAVFPFCGAIVENYSAASCSGFLYLFFSSISICFTVLKMFSHQEFRFIIALFAITTLIYSYIKSIFMDDLLKLISLFSVIQYSIFLCYTTVPDVNKVEHLIVRYFFISIIYKTLFNLSTVIFIDKYNIRQSSLIVKTNNIWIISGWILSILHMISFPFTASFFIKSMIANTVMDKFYFLITSFFNIVLIASLPWNRYISLNKYSSCTVNITDKVSIILVSILLFASSCLYFIGWYVDGSILFSSIDVSIFTVIKQILIIFTVILVSQVIFIKHGNQSTINLVIDIGNMLAKFYGYAISLISSIISRIKNIILAKLVNISISVRGRVESVNYLCDQRFAISIILVLLIFLLFIFVHD
ncbi:proton-conducting transporter transmembrane domain-containing protein [Rickettsia endosymbiont of Cardiosporidium cionae]|uniref:proton-conducting transporter transmembrane domain-containing protein n=1 Tax=Rickettsia endosymbiont of Cardiosporidium cionae TaxID=2777155 RepID=UPI0018960AE9|nr:proton-conducting transporter membrane subunit [Rickettsia endosymbiont of Cardiosporidium cionae]KAF8818242.1 hypothetical protein IHI24_000701 [Rickettsia endosymbiont of Cardiosporidium cionae]